MITTVIAKEKDAYLVPDKHALLAGSVVCLSPIEYRHDTSFWIRDTFEPAVFEQLVASIAQGVCLPTLFFSHFLTRGFFFLFLFYFFFILFRGLFHRREPAGCLHMPQERPPLTHLCGAHAGAAQGTLAPTQPAGGEAHVGFDARVRAHGLSRLCGRRQCGRMTT